MPEDAPAQPTTDTPTTTADREQYGFVVVSNRLPVDRVVADDGTEGWRHSPGGLVTALEPVMRANDGAWVGWAGQADVSVDPFDNDGIHIVPVPLSEDELRDYYEGFSNDTLWPLYHDVIEQPTYHRDWWNAYKRVNQRFAEAAAAVTEENGVVWVQDYQLQLVPRLIRELRPDVTIGFFNHIPFPAVGIYAQLPWRAQIIDGLLGADVIGFQRHDDASNFLRAVRHIKGYTTKGSMVNVPVDDPDAPRSRRGISVRQVEARHFPISIDADSYEEIARRPEVQARAREIREGLGNPDTVLLGVDRLDYTKGIRHRIKAFGELIEDGTVDVEDATLVQVASPSRERVDTYMTLRDDIELMVGRINGDLGTISHQPIAYLHHGYPREEMVALYLAADIMLVTALRDGMNLVAKEYVASRFDNDGVLVLSEFAGAADELRQALLINPHDIEALKVTITRGMEMPRRERSTRMRALRKRVKDNDVARWSRLFIEALDRHTTGPGIDPESVDPGDEHAADQSDTVSVEARDA
ncbi:alpha,alpha-trehalose-phosphate synthase (UDP-forming) [Curtobacterium sp. Leaf261]|uniref:alpha,alpha-trehalose-phosphate synthase (UDP-forming) n=1 Tax=Curtobacterium sp. Leaf261 TaxID=1736311 RepID=UPI0006FB9297|nr:trehalose-6-phosphate synthase [Curtobacterium sp. Leaf261]KQO62108.1 trehalose-phosphate synthase [Curtobacterium sp. Leaf261]